MALASEGDVPESKKTLSDFTNEHRYTFSFYKSVLIIVIRGCRCPSKLETHGSITVPRRTSTA